jgi:hypothetical protein
MVIPALIFFLTLHYADALGQDTVFNLRILALLIFAIFMLVAFVCGFAGRDTLYGKVGTGLSGASTLILVPIVPIISPVFLWLIGGIACFVQTRLSSRSRPELCDS